MQGHHHGPDDLTPSREMLGRGQGARWRRRSGTRAATAGGCDMPWVRTRGHVHALSNAGCMWNGCTTRARHFTHWTLPWGVVSRRLCTARSHNGVSVHARASHVVHASCNAADSGPTSWGGPPWPPDNPVRAPFTTPRGVCTLLIVLIGMSGWGTLGTLSDWEEQWQARELGGTLRGAT